LLVCFYFFLVSFFTISRLFSGLKKIIFHLLAHSLFSQYFFFIIILLLYFIIIIVVVVAAAVDVIEDIRLT